MNFDNVFHITDIRLLTLKKIGIGVSSLFSSISVREHKNFKYTYGGSQFKYFRNFDDAIW